MCSLNVRLVLIQQVESRAINKDRIKQAELDALFGAERANSSPQICQLTVSTASRPNS